MDMARRTARRPRENRGLTKTFDHVQIDWPRSLGFFGGLGAAVAFDLVPIPIALFVASVPLFKLLNQPDAPTPQRFVSHVVQGAAKPVGGDSEGTIRWTGGDAGPARSNGSPRRRRTTSLRKGGTR
jgi:hypothetical protein